MRIEIKTGGKPIKDRDIRALYVLDYAMQLSTDRMLNANLQFVISKYQKKMDSAKKKALGKFARHKSARY